MGTFDLVILTVSAIAFIIGFATGFIKQISLLAGVVLGAVFSGQLAALVAPKLLTSTDISAHIIGPLSYIIAFIIIFVALLLIGKLLQSLLKAVKINTLNRIAGALFSIATWLVIASIVLNIVAEMDQDETIITKNTQENSITYPIVKDIATTVIPYLRFDWISQQ